TDGPTPPIDGPIVPGPDSSSENLVALFDFSADSTRASEWGRAFVAGVAGLPQVTRHAVARVDWNAFSDSGLITGDSTLKLNLFPEVNVTAGRFEVVVDTVSGVRRERWTGIDVADSLSELVLARYPDSLFVYLTYPRTR